MAEVGWIRAGVARLVVRTADAVTRMLGVSPAAGREEISEAELRDLVAANRVLDGGRRRLIDDVLVAGDRQVREVMVPRTEVVFLAADLPVAEAVRLVRDASHSRFPVTESSPDEVVGFVHLRDLLLRPAGARPGTVGQLMREIKELPASKRILPALSEMRRERRHLAIVVDEYGGTAGIVTLEDLIEELVGEIHDEYDQAPAVDLDGAGVPTEVEGLLNLADFAERTGVVLPDGPYETVGGYLMAALGKLPVVGDEVWAGADGGDDAGEPVRLVVTALDGRRVDRVALRHAEPREDVGGGAAAEPTPGGDVAALTVAAAGPAAGGAVTTGTDSEPVGGKR